MSLMFEDRESDSPYVERVWRSWSDHEGTFNSVALGHWQLVVWADQEKKFLSLRGPETKVTRTTYPAHREFVGMVFKVGTLMPDFPVSTIVDGQITLPHLSNRTFWLKGAAWELPTFENADTFINRLVDQALLMREPVIDRALRGARQELSLRSVQRRFTQNLGLTHTAIYQIDRARQATLLLKHGVAILDVVQMLGYADQPHLTRSLKRYIGFTPAQVISRDAEVSFLFKTEDLHLA